MPTINQLIRHPRVVQKSKKKVQVGTQQRSMTHINKAKEIVAAGKLGSINRIRLSWNRDSDRVKRFKGKVDPKSVDWKKFLGNAKKQDFDEYRFRSWRWFWDFGGGIFTDLMVHWIDVAHWLMDLDMPLMDGFQFLDEFEKLSSATKKKCRIVMLTSSINPQDFNRSKKYDNVKLYLNKPSLTTASPRSTCSRNRSTLRSAFLQTCRQT